MQRSGVRPSVRCTSYHSTAAAACGGFAAERRAGGRYRSTATAPQHGAQQQMRGVTLTDEAEHRLVIRPVSEQHLVHCLP